ncbi:MAG: arginase [Armatimonadetes bacterium]|nr:arginase [Armatimonadota bacterium]
MIELIGAPFDLGGKRSGSQLTGAALRLAGFQSALGAVVGTENIRDNGDIQLSFPASPADGLHAFEAALETYSKLKSRVGESFARGATPLVMGGSHDISIGSISAALEATKGDLAVLWIDAHADLNTPATSPSGNLHGMPLTALCGLETGSVAESKPWANHAEAQWQKLIPATKLKSNQIAWFGLREVDPGEIQNMNLIPGCRPYTMHDVDRYTIPKILNDIDLWLRGLGTKNLWISFDVDSLDPVLAPGTGTMVRGGLTYRESHLVAELLCESLRAKDCPYKLAGLDVVEVNPILDNLNETAHMAVEWVCSLFGKAILDQWVPTFKKGI